MVKEKTFRKIKILSVILGFFYCGGALWYGELFFSRPLPLLLLLASTGIALVITPLLSDTLLRLHYIRLLAMFLILTGIAGSLYSIGEVITSTGYWWDLLFVILQHIAIIFVLIILTLEIRKKGQADINAPS